MLSKRRVKIYFRTLGCTGLTLQHFFFLKHHSKSLNPASVEHTVKNPLPFTLLCHLTKQLFVRYRKILKYIYVKVHSTFDRK